VATESLGDMEVLDALIAREKFYARVGDKEAALKAADDVSGGPEHRIGFVIGIGAGVCGCVSPWLVVALAFFFFLFVSSGGRDGWNGCGIGIGIA
jgi:hypothetical protein